MKKYLSLIILILALSFILPTLSLALGMSVSHFTADNNAGISDNMINENNIIAENNDEHTAREEDEGKAVWKKLQAKELSCENLSNDNFSALGEYFMGQMMGGSHETMNNMMIQMMGEEGEKQTHIAMGKRMSNCEPNAPMPQSIINSGMMPMMNSMMEDWSNPSALTNHNLKGVASRPYGADNPMSSMMNFGFTPFGWLGLIFMILFWVLIIIGIVVLIKWLANQNKSESKNEQSALGILRERYAKGEIDKKEFEEKKKDLS